MSPIKVFEANEGKHVCEDCPLAGGQDFVTSNRFQMSEHIFAHDLASHQIPPETYDSYKVAEVPFS